jgi:hypothetical protein
MRSIRRTKVHPGAQRWPLLHNAKRIIGTRAAKEKIIDARLRDNPRYAIAAGARRNSSWRSRAGCGRHGANAGAPAPGALPPAPFAVVDKPSALSTALKTAR